MSQRGWPHIAIASFVFTAVMVAGAGRAVAADIFAAPNGIATNNGTISQPIDLATALSTHSPAKPGDTIWLRGGTYTGTFVSYLTGTQAAPITVRQYPGERATLNGGGSPADLLTVYGEWAVYWGFELTASDPGRLSAQTGPWPNDLHRGVGATIWGSNLRFINLVFHDLASGIGLWKEAVNTEVYGSLFFYNGWQAPDGSHGHGIYTQNLTGARLIRENIAFSQFSMGFHAYGSAAAFLNDITMEGNVAFNNGVLGTSGFERDFLLGGGVLAKNPVLRENYTYGGAQSNLGYGAGCVNGKVLDNYFVGSTPLILVACAPLMTGNVFYNLQASKWGWGATNFRPQDYPANAYYAQPPATNFVKVRPNLYEAGRGNIVVYNWLHKLTVQVDLTPLQLAIGDPFEIRDAQNFYGTPVVTGVYDGTPVFIPMYGLTLQPPVGSVPVMPQHTAPEFGVFVAMRPSTGSTPPPLPPATVAAPTFSPAGGSFTGPVTVSLASSTPGAVIRYTTNGTTPTSASSLYGGPFVLSATTTINARAFAAGFLDSAVATAAYTISQPTTATPTINPAGGSFTGPVIVSLASVTTGAQIRYTTDGSTPTSTSTLYSMALRVAVTTTVKARAFAAGFLNSATATASFTIAAPVVGGGTSAAFLGLDNTTQGGWHGVYGNDGAMVVADATSYPAYAQVTAAGLSAWTWLPWTAEVRGLQRMTAPERLAAAWYGPFFTIDVNIKDGQSHQIALYAVDWDTVDRKQQVDVRDAVTGALLDSRVTSGFNGGIYLVWRITGHVTIQLTKMAGYNAVVSGLFFDH